MNINIVQLSEKTGRGEVEIARALFLLLCIIHQNESFTLKLVVEVEK